MPFDDERLIRIPINSVNHELGFKAIIIKCRGSQS